MSVRLRPPANSPLFLYFIKISFLAIFLHMLHSQICDLSGNRSGSRLDPVSNLVITREKGYFDDSGRRLPIREDKT